MLSCLYCSNAQGAKHEEDCCDEHHIILMRTNHSQERASNCRGNDLRQTDCTIKQPKVSSFMPVAFKCVSYKSKRHCQHCSPSTTNQKERNY